MKGKVEFRIAVYCLFLSHLVSAQDLQRALPEDVGLSSGKLKRIEIVTNEMINTGSITGAVALVARKNKVVYMEAFGDISPDSKKDLNLDNIFRIASMTKAVTTVGVMKLFEEGEFFLDDPIAKYIPEFNSMKIMVMEETDGKPYRLEEAKNQITIRHLLNHTSGITYKFWGQPHIAEIYEQNGITDGLANTENTLAENTRILAGLPLLHESGDQFSYGLNTDVLGYLIEVISGKSLNEYLRENIFNPLKMDNTHFFLPDQKVERLVPVSLKQESGLVKAEGDVVEKYDRFTSDYHYNGTIKYVSGGGGLVSTVEDYYRFLQMLLNGGEYNGTRILGNKTVELMTSPQMDIDYPWGNGFRFGFGFSISMGPSYTGLIESKGTYGWSGYFSTFFFVDPSEDLIGIIMTQTRPYNNVIERKFKNAVYQSLVD